MQSVTVLGSTGSIGRSTLEVIQLHPSRYRLFAISAQSNWKLALEQIRAFAPTYCVMVDQASGDLLAQAVKEEGLSSEVLIGSQALQDISSSSEVDVVMAAIVGAAGLLPTLSAAKAGKKVLLANKEALVMAGQVFMDAVKLGGAQLLPIDSEHNAIFQCLPPSHQGGATQGVKHINLTASGGPFRGWTRADLQSVTVEQAVAHPNWSMGQKISVDSATLMNKGLELVEACWLFDLQPKDVEVVIHPESIIHSMVQYVDGSVIAQMGNPDMKTPIAYGLSYPERIDAGVADLNFFDVARLTFEKPDHKVFPSLKYAAQAFDEGGVAMAHLNAANEVAVQAFLDRKISFDRIFELQIETFEHLPVTKADSLEAVLEADQQARAFAASLV